MNEHVLSDDDDDETKEDLSARAVLLLGHAVRNVAKAASQQPLSRLKRQLGASRIKTGQVQGEGRIAQASSDFFIYAVAFYKTSAEARRALEVNRSRS